MMEKALQPLDYSGTPLYQGEKVDENATYATEPVVRVALVATSRKTGAAKTWSRDLTVADLVFMAVAGRADFAAWAFPGDEVFVVGGETAEEAIARELDKWLATNGGRRYRRGYDLTVEGLLVLPLGDARYLLTRRRVHVLPSFLKWKTWEDAREPLGILDLEQFLRGRFSRE